MPRYSYVEVEIAMSALKIARCLKFSRCVPGALLRRVTTLGREVGILLPNYQRQHRNLHIQEDGLPYALC